MGRVFYILIMFLATLVTNLFLLLLRQKSIKEPKLIYLTQDKGSRPLTCLFYQKIYSALSFCVGTCFSQIIHVLCWTAPLPGIQPVVQSLSCSMSFSVVCFPSSLSLIQCVCLLSAPHLLLIECSQLGSHGCRRLVRKRLQGLRAVRPVTSSPVFPKRVRVAYPSDLFDNQLTIA